MRALLKIFVLFSLAILFQSCTLTKNTKGVDGNIIQSAMIKAVDWQEANPIFAKSPTDWTNGAYYLGVTKAHESTKDNHFLKVLNDMATRNEWKPWQRYYHADDLIIAYSYLYLKRNGAKNANLKPTDDFINDHLNKPHFWKDGSSKGTEKILWWWCDALFMAPPVLSAYAKDMNNQSYLKQMDNYYLQTYTLLYDKKENLFSRDSRYLWTGKDSDIKEKNGKKVFWSRGNGWVLAGLALTLAHMPKDYENRPFYEKLYLDMAFKLKNIQHEDGMWRTSLLSPESFDHGEVSGSGFFVYALAWGINNGLLKKADFQPLVLKGWKAILQCQQENGKVGWVQNIGADPKPANANSWQNFGTGAFLMAGSEILKLK